MVRVLMSVESLPFVATIERKRCMRMQHNMRQRAILWCNPMLSNRRGRQDVSNIQNIRVNCDVNISIIPLCTAANRKFTHALRILLENGGMVDGVDPPHFIGNPLLRALRSGCEEAVEILYQFGAQFNLRTHQGIQSTALEHVVKHHPTSDLINALLEKYGSDIGLEDSFGRTLVSPILAL